MFSRNKFKCIYNSNSLYNIKKKYGKLYKKM